jgi:hypothetical protein
MRSEPMTMRENCRHYESRTYDNGETARFCVLDLAPEAPWRCPDDCPKFEVSANDGSFEMGSLETTPVEDEPDDDPDDIAAVLRDAEEIVNAGEPEIVGEFEGASRPKRGWKFWKKPPDDGEFHMSQR